MSSVLVTEWTTLFEPVNLSKITIGSDGSIYIAAETSGDLDGQTNYGYDDAFIIKYNPDGRAGSYKETNYSAFQLNHMISPKLFYELKLSVVDNNYGNYLFKDPLAQSQSFNDYDDTGYFVADGYIHDKYFDGYGPGFLTGGQSKNHEIRNTIDQTGKIDLTWQVNHTHSLKTGFHFFRHEIDNQWRSIRNKYHNTANDSVYAPEKV